MTHPLKHLGILEHLGAVVVNPCCQDCKTKASRYEELLWLALASLVEAKTSEEMTERHWLLLDLIRESTQWINGEHAETEST